MYEYAYICIDLDMHMLTYMIMQSTHLDIFIYRERERYTHGHIHTCKCIDGRRENIIKRHTCAYTYIYLIYTYMAMCHLREDFGELEALTQSQGYAIE